MKNVKAPVVRNPVARELASSKFRKRVVQDKTKYSRKQKHRKEY